MLAIVYLLFTALLGDAICRRVLTFVSPIHRIACACLTGFLISSFWTYLCCRLFAASSSPMLWGNILFFITAGCLMVWLWRKPAATSAAAQLDTPGSAKWDWIFIGIFLAFSTWMMFTTLNMSEGVIEIGNHEFPDFGSSLSIMQSFAVGHNFPSEFPHFSGDRIRYHFLFYFLAGDLEYLGLNLAVSNNILSILTMTSMLGLIMTLARVLFGSRTVGRLAAILFFFHGSLAFVPFYRSTTSWSDLFEKIWKLPMFLPSGLHYRGEDWGVWSQVVFLNQRHFASAIGLFLMVMTFLVMRIQKRQAEMAAARAAEEELLLAEQAAEAEAAEARAAQASRDIAHAAAYEGISPATDHFEVSDRRSEDRTSAPSSTGDESEDGEILELPPLAASDPTRALEDVDDVSSNAEPPADGFRHVVNVTPHSEDVEDISNGEETPAVEFDRISGMQDELAGEGAVGEKDVPALTGEHDDISGLAEQDDHVDPGTDLRDETYIDRPNKTFRKGRKRSFSPIKWIFGDQIERVWPLLFAGIVLGLLPLWNGAVFTTAFVVLGVMFFLFPIRRQLIVVAVVSGLFGLPQIWYLTSGMRPAGYSIFRFGYTIDDATVYEVVYYLLFTFGFKWILLAIGLYFSKWIHRGLFIAFTGLIVVAFSFRFSEEVLVNHKFINIWLIFTNILVAYGFVRIWNLSIAGWKLPSRLIAVALLFLIMIGGVIDLFPIKNSFFITIKYENDRLVNWVKENTDPRSVFLSQRYINHQILMAGRRLYYGEPYYAWGAGYDTNKRDQTYRRLFESTNISEVFELLKENHISYVAIDDAVRNPAFFIKKTNESLYAAYFPLVFEDDENLYGHIKIYKVTEQLDAPNPTVEAPKVEPPSTPVPAETFNAFLGGTGTEPGHFAGPRGVCSDSRGNIYVADTGNARVQKFDREGKFIALVGSAGTGSGELRQPNGVAVDRAGNIYVTDSGSQKLLKYGPDGKFISEWTGPDTGFYGPRDIAFGPNDHLYIVDQGRTRIARFDPTTEQFTAWGTAGDGTGQFNEPTGIAIGDGLVYVADAQNDRIQVFDLDGKFIREWPIATWEKYSGHYPDIAFDDLSRRLFVTNGRNNEVLSFDMNGNQLENLAAPAGSTFQNPSSLFITQTNEKRRLLILNTGGSRLTAVDLESGKTK